MFIPTHFGNGTAVYFVLSVIVVTVLWRWFMYKPVRYSFTLVERMREMGYRSSIFPLQTYYLLRLALLCVLGLLILKPQIADKRTKLPVEGIDIMMVMDLSGSMQSFDDQHDRKTRISIAKEEAIKFVNKRNNDALGLVVFGANVMSRAPLTHDKTILTDIIQDIELGDLVDPDGTVLARGLLAGVNRLKHSDAHSKIIILLTDGEPTGADINPDRALEVAKQLGVKVYVVGIGGDNGGFRNHPMYGLVQAGMPLNTLLLEYIARETGGKFFKARNQQEMHEIYETIDALETTAKEVELYTQYQDIFLPWLWIALLLISLELLLSTFIWRVV